MRKVEIRKVGEDRYVLVDKKTDEVMSHEMTRKVGVDIVLKRCFGKQVGRLFDRADKKLVVLGADDPVKEEVDLSFDTGDKEPDSEDVLEFKDDSLEDTNE